MIFFFGMRTMFFNNVLISSLLWRRYLMSKTFLIFCKSSPEGTSESQPIYHQCQPLSHWRKKLCFEWELTLSFASFLPLNKFSLRLLSHLIILTLLPRTAFQFVLPCLPLSLPYHFLHNATHRQTNWFFLPLCTSCMILLALSFLLCLVNTLLTILNSSSLCPLKSLPASKCSLDFFTILLPFPGDSNTRQKLQLPNFQPPFFQSPLHHFLSSVSILSKQNCSCKSTTLSSAQPFTSHHRPMFVTFGALQFLTIVLLSTHLMGTAMWSRIFHFCNCFSSCSQNFSLFVFALAGSQSLQKIFVYFTLCFVTHSMSNPSNLLSNSPNCAVLPRNNLAPPRTAPGGGLPRFTHPSRQWFQRFGVPAWSPACSCHSASCILPNLFLLSLWAAKRKECSPKPQAPILCFCGNVSFSSSISHSGSFRPEFPSLRSLPQFLFGNCNQRLIQQFPSFSCSTFFERWSNVFHSLLHQITCVSQWISLRDLSTNSSSSWALSAALFKMVSNKLHLQDKECPRPPATCRVVCESISSKSFFNSSTDTGIPGMRYAVAKMQALFMCCKFAAHQHCVARDADVLCPCSGEDLQPTFDTSSFNAVPKSILVGSTVLSRDCVICTEMMTRENNIKVLPPSIPCDMPCPFLLFLRVANQSLSDSAKSSSFSASNFFHKCMIDMDRPLPSNWPATPIWTVVHLLWHIWQLNGCAWTFRMFHPHMPLPVPNVRICPPWWWMYVAVSQHWSWCSRCQLSMPSGGLCCSTPYQWINGTDWFTKAHWAAWDACMAGRPPCTAPTQRDPIMASLPLWSLALAGAERAHEPPDQQRFWLSTVQNIIDSPLTSSPQSPIALELQKPDSWAPFFAIKREKQALNVWLTDQYESHSIHRTNPPPVANRNVPDPPFRDLLLHLSLRNWKSSFVITNGCFVRGK